MKGLAVFVMGLALAVLCWTEAWAQVRVRPYVRQDGTYVQPHYRSRPDGNIFNNYSTSPNINPYTGQRGYVNPYAPPSNPYGNTFNSQRRSRMRNTYGW